MTKRIKILLVFIGLLINCNLIIAQNYERIVDTNKTWNILQFCSTPYDVFSTMNVKIKNDTTLDNLVYNKVYTSYDSLTYSYYGLLREDSNGRVFFNDNYHEYLLYDFNANIGDTFNYSFLFCGSNAVVVNIDSVFTVNKYRKRIHTFFSEIGVYDYWLEGIGSMIGIISPGYVLMDNGSNLLCYWKNSELLFSTEYANTFGCSYSNVGIHKVNNEYDIKIYPTITTQQITVENKYIGQLTLQIYNLFGVEVFRKIITEKSQLLDLSNLPKGFYLLQILDDKRQLQKYEKIILK